MSSSFRSWTITVFILLVLASVMNICICVLLIMELPHHQLAAWLISGMLIYINFRLVTGEWRNKAVRVDIDKNGIVIRRWLGLARKEDFLFLELDGYTIGDFPSRVGSYEYLFLMKGGKKLVSISEFYHENYRQLKSAVDSQLKYIGWVDYDPINSLKETFL